MKAGTLVAVCPDCEDTKDVAVMPAKGYWLVCVECSQPMNIYRRVPNVGRKPAWPART